MDKSIIIGFLALILGLGLGMAAMTMLSDAPTPSMNHASTANRPTPAPTPAPESNPTSVTPHQPAEVVKAPVKPAPVIAEPTPVESAGNSDPLSATLLERVGFEEIEGVISGTVHGADGKPAKGATIHAAPNLWAKQRNNFSTFNDGAPPDLDAPANQDYLNRQAAVKAYTRAATSDAEGNYTITGLIDTSYTISCYAKGQKAHPHGSNYAKVGGNVEFTLEPIRSVIVNIKMPDGTEPSEAVVTVGGSFGGNSYGNWGVSEKSQYNSYDVNSSYNNRGSQNHQWTPSDKEVSLVEGVWIISAYTGEHDFVSQRINVDALTEGTTSTITLNLEAQNGLKVKLETEDPDVPIAHYYVHAHLASLGDIPIAEFYSTGKYLTGDGTGVYTLNDVEPGVYTVSVAVNNKIVASKQVVLTEGVKSQETLKVGRPDRADYVAVTLQGVKPYEWETVTFKNGYRANDRDYSNGVYFLIRRNDGTVWIPHYTNGKNDPVDAEYFIEATLKGQGQSRASYTKTMASAVTLGFQEPGILRVQFSGFDKDVPAYRSASVSLVPEKEDKKVEYEKRRSFYNNRVQSSGSVGQVDDNGVIYVTGITPGRYTLSVNFAGTTEQEGVQKQMLTIVSGMNSAVANLPPIYDVVVEFPDDGTSTSPYWVYLYANKKYLAYKQVGATRRVNFGKFPPGNYRIMTAKQKYMDILLASNGNFLFQPAN